MTTVEGVAALVKERDALQKRVKRLLAEVKKLRAADRVRTRAALKLLHRVDEMGWEVKELVEAMYYAAPESTDQNTRAVEQGGD